MALITRTVITTGGGDYTSLNAWEATEQTDLVTAGNSHIVYCSGSTDDSNLLTLNGWITGASNTITIQGDQTTGVFDASKYTLIPTDHWQGVPRIDNNYVTLKRVQIDLSSWASGLEIHGSNTIVESLIIKDGTNANTPCVYILGQVVIKSCLIYGGAGHAVYLQTFSACTVVNCTISNSDYGVYRYGGTENHIITNCAVFGCSSDFEGTMIVSYCASDDGDGSNAQTLSTTRSDDFTGYAISGTSSTLYDTGTATGRPSTDITGYTWVTNDIGAFAWQVTAKLLAIIMKESNQFNGGMI